MKIKFTRLVTRFVPMEGASALQSLSLEQGHPDPVAASQSIMVAESRDTRLTLPVSNHPLLFYQEGPGQL